MRRISIRSCRTRSIVRLRWRIPIRYGRATSPTSGPPRAGSLRAPGHCLGDGEPPDSGVGHGGAHHGPGTPTIDERRVASYGPRRPVRRHPVPRDAGRLRPDGEHESAGELRGQCRGRKLRSYVENRARVASARQHSGRGQAGYF